MKILGIDPGTRRIGYGLIEKSKELKLLKYGVLEVGAKSEAGKISELARKLSALIDECKPEVCGVEKIYFAKNQKTAMAVSQARGVILHLILKQGIILKEFRPGDVKLAVTGYGAADKRAVSKMVKRILKCGELKGYDDASDALAVAITAAYSINPLNKALGSL